MIGSAVIASSQSDSSCFGKAFVIVCDHPDLLAVENKTNIFIDSLANWKRDGLPLAIDDVIYRVEKSRTRSKLIVNYNKGHFSNPGINTFSCFLRGKDGIVFESHSVSVEIPGILIDFAKHISIFIHAHVCFHLQYRFSLFC